MGRLIQKHGDKGCYWVRPAFKADDYAVPSWARKSIESYRGDYHDVDSQLSERDGAFYGWKELGRFSRDGKNWALLQHSAAFCIEVEVLKLGFGEVIYLSPERAYQIACEQDKKYPEPVVHE